MTDNNRKKEILSIFYEITRKLMKINKMFSAFPSGATSTMLRYIYRYLFTLINNDDIRNLLEMEILLMNEYLSDCDDILGDDFFIKNLITGSFDLYKNLDDFLKDVINDFDNIKINKELIILLKELVGDNDDILLLVLLIIVLHMYYLESTKQKSDDRLFNLLLDIYKVQLEKIDLLKSLLELLEKIFELSKSKENVKTLKEKINIKSSYNCEH